MEPLVDCNINSVYQKLQKFFRCVNEEDANSSLKEKISYCLSTFDEVIDAEKLNNKEFLEDLTTVIVFFIRHIKNDRVYTEESNELCASILYKILHINQLTSVNTPEKYDNEEAGGC